jgi:superfamily II DNA or RNA helicase
VGQEGGMMALAYADFIEMKRRRHGDVGRDIDPDELHPSMFGFQRAITAWACRKGRAAVFADCGLGKSRIQLEWARMVGTRSLIVAPLSVARQTVREAHAIGIDLHYVRNGLDADSDGLWITNYEMIERFDPAMFDAVVIDESSILKNVEGKTRRLLTEMFAETPLRLACTATPAPNDVAELTNHAEFLGVMPRNEMLAAYFVHDDEGWRLKGHAQDPMYKWMATWGVALRRPSDLGYSDEGYNLPPLSIIPEIVQADIEAEGQLFATELGGIGGRSKVRKATMSKRVQRAVDLARGDEQWIVWCGLNDEADACAKAIDGAVNVEGSWAPERKAAALEAFQDGTVRVLVTKVTIAGFGMNFQNCHQMAFVGLGDSYEQYYQAIRRCYRFGQTRPVEAHVVLSTLESQIAINVQRKEATALAVTDRLVAHVRQHFEGATA